MEIGINYNAVTRIHYQSQGPVSETLRGQKCRNNEIEKDQFIGFKNLLDELLSIKKISLASPELDLVVSADAT
ncbi:MAG: hypothetical protein NVSMB24_39990 [Mucilaginibacter sp.]